MNAPEASPADASPADAIPFGSTVVISHEVRPGAGPAYERWLDEIGPACRAFPGHLDWHLVRPVAGVTATYTVIVRFDTDRHLGAWMRSEERARLVDRVRPFLNAGDDYAIRSGLDFWFAGSGGAARVPVRWKQFLVTWSAIYPLALGAPFVASPLLGAAGVPDGRFATTLVVTGTVVFLMTYVVMPRYTRLVRKWLFA